MTIDHTAALLARLSTLPEADRLAVLALVDALVMAPTPNDPEHMHDGGLPASFAAQDYNDWFTGPRQDALNLIHHTPTED